MLQLLSLELNTALQVAVPCHAEISLFLFLILTIDIKHF